MNNIPSNKSIKKRLLSIMTFFTLAVSLLTTSYCYFSYQSILFDSLKQSTEYSLLLLAETIQYDLNNALSLADFSTSNQTVSSYLSASNNKQANTSSFANLAWKRLQEEYLSNSSSSYINRVLISDLNHEYIQLSPYVIYQNLPCAKLIENQPFFHQLYDSDTYEWVGFVPDPINPDSKNNEILPVIRPIYSEYGKHISGWCFLAISPNIFLNRLKNYTLTSGSQLYITLGDTTYILEQGKLMKTSVSYSVKESIPNTNGQSQIITVYDSHGKQQTIVSFAAADQSWFISQSISQAGLSKQTSVYMSSLLFIISIVIMLGITLTIYMHYLINKPLIKLQQKIQAVSTGNFTPDSCIEWNNELGEIGKGINIMGENISQLITSRMKDQEKKYELEYEILQSQINPHFLYNTLSSIIWMASAQGANGIHEMSVALSQILKSVSKKSAAAHTLREELELVKNYFLIQKYRYGGMLSMNCCVEDELLYDCMVPKFILQIAVENSIFHGIEPKKIGGLVEIVVTKCVTHNDVLISITDNGIGMTKEQIDHVLNKTPASSDLFRKIGIHNIQKRIHYSYGHHYGISIKSLPGSCTTILITLPCQRKEDSPDVSTFDCR